MLYKRFQKAPENRESLHISINRIPRRHAATNPSAFNQAQVAYNASKDEKLDKLKEVIGAREAKYKVGQ
jgi:hypothetical protein